MYNNPQTVEEAVNQCTPLVKFIVSKWIRNHYGDYNDLCQAGYMGVVEAFNRFDKKKNVKFSTYAFWWIRRRVKDTATDNWKVMNNSAPEEWGMSKETYEIDEEAMDIANMISKLTDRDQEMMIMRAQGYTFDEIKDKIGANSIGSVRNRIMKLTAEMNK